MKRVIVNILIFFLQSVSYAQMVENFAGVSTQAGFANSIDKTQALFNNVHGLDISQDGTMFIADRYNHSIRKIDTNGVVTTVAGNGIAGDAVGPGLQAQFNEPWDVCVGNNGEVYIADAKNNKIKVLYANGIVATYAGTGNVGFTDNTRLASSFYWPSGIEYDHKTNTIYVADHLSHLIRKINASGQVSTLAGSKANFPNNFGAVDGVGSQAKFYRPYGIHLSNDGKLYVADEWNSLIRKVSLTGVVTTIGGQAEIDGYKNGIKDSSLFNYPWDITTDLNNQIYVLDGYNHVIRKIDPVTYESTLFAGNPNLSGAQNGTLLEARFNGATGIQYFQGSLYLSDAFNHVIRRIDLLEKIAVKEISEGVKCKGDTVNLEAIPAYFDKYYWYQGTELISITDEPKLNYRLTGFDEISVQGERDGVGLSVSDTLLFDRKMEEIEIELTPLNSYCQGDSVRLESGFSNAVWNIGTVSNQLVVKQNGVYSFEVYESSCLVKEGSVDIAFETLPVIEVSPKIAYLGVQDSVVFTVSGAHSYLWSNGSNQTQWVTKKSGNYTVQGYSQAGCASLPKTVQVSADLFIEANPDEISLDYAKSQFLLVLENDNWYAPVKINLLNTTISPIQMKVVGDRIFFENNSIIKDSSFTIYYAICYVESPEICAQTSVEIKTVAPPYSDLDYLFFPEGFSPNDDEVNDYFQILGIERAVDNRLEIYNRWGQLIYVKENYYNDWNGTNNSNEPLLEGTYFYIFEDKISGENYNGYVVLQR